MHHKIFLGSPCSVARHESLSKTVPWKSGMWVSDLGFLSISPLPKWTWVATNRYFVMAFSRPEAPFEAVELWAGPILNPRYAHDRCYPILLQQLLDQHETLWSTNGVITVLPFDYICFYEWDGGCLYRRPSSISCQMSSLCRRSPAITNFSLGLGVDTQDATHEDPTVELLLLGSIIQLDNPGWVVELVPSSHYGGTTRLFRYLPPSFRT